MLGDQGTEQFTVETLVDGKSIQVQPIHDPFIYSHATVRLGRWDHFLAIFWRRDICVDVVVRGSEGATRSIMTLDPEKLQKDTEEILEQRKASRESSSAIGLYSTIQADER